MDLATLLFVYQHWPAYECDLSQTVHNHRQGELLSFVSPHTLMKRYFFFEVLMKLKMRFLFTHNPGFLSDSLSNSAFPASKWLAYVTISAHTATDSAWTS
jgi:hypothetical protein